MISPTRCVVNYAEGSWYPRGQARLASILASQGVPFLAFSGSPPGMPPHRDHPYYFKPWCIQQAWDRGYTDVLWMDASAVPQRPVSLLFEVVASEGLLVIDNPGHTTGRWATDESLRIMGLTREQAFRTPHCAALVCGFSKAHPTGREVYRAWREYGDAGAFAGPWTNKDGSCSPDPRVEGHRHDQTVLSVVAHRQGVAFKPMGVFLDYGRERPDAYVAAYPP